MKNTEGSGVAKGARSPQQVIDKRNMYDKLRENNNNVRSTKK